MATTVVAAGGLVLAADMNNALTKRIGSTSLTANSATFTTVVVIASVTVNLVSGMTYALKWEGRFSTTVASPTTELILVRIKLGATTAGTDLNVTQSSLATNSASGFGVDLYAEYTAPSTGSVTFSVTAERTTSPAATGNYALRSSATGPAYFVVDSLGI